MYIIIIKSFTYKSEPYISYNYYNIEFFNVFVKNHTLKYLLFDELYTNIANILRILNIFNAKHTHTCDMHVYSAIDVELKPSSSRWSGQVRPLALWIYDIILIFYNSSLIILSDACAFVTYQYYLRLEEYFLSSLGY